MSFFVPLSCGQVAPGTFHQHSYSQHHLPLHSHGLHAAYVTSYAPYPTQATFAASPMQGLAAGPGGQLYHTSAAPPHLRQVASTVPAAVQVYSPSCQVSSHSLATPAAPTVAHIHAIHSMDNGSNPGNSPANSGELAYS